MGKPSKIKSGTRTVSCDRFIKPFLARKIKFKIKYMQIIIAPNLAVRLYFNKTNTDQIIITNTI